METHSLTPGAIAPGISPVLGTVTQVAESVEGVTSCDAMNNRNVRANRLLGHNKEIVLLGEDGAGIWNKEGARFPSDVSLSGRNLLVSEYADGSMRIERVQSAKSIPQDSDTPAASDRLIGSRLIVDSHGVTFVHPVVIFSKEGAMKILDEGE